MPPSHTHYTLPSRLGAALSHLPAYPGSLLLATALNAMLAPQLPNDVRQYLRGKRLRIHVRDARLTFDLSCNSTGFAACPPEGTTDLTLSAHAHDFLRLVQRQEDPDTLFFNRRLSMEGDTELGLVVKNAMDALELPVLDPHHWSPPQLLARWRARRHAPSGQGGPG